MKIPLAVALLLATSVIGFAYPHASEQAALNQQVVEPDSRQNDAIIAAIAAQKDPADSKTFVCKCEGKGQTTCNKGDTCDCRGSSARCIPPKK